MPVSIRWRGLRMYMFPAIHPFLRIAGDDPPAAKPRGQALRRAVLAISQDMQCTAAEVWHVDAPDAFSMQVAPRGERFRCLPAGKARAGRRMPRNGCRAGTAGAGPACRRQMSGHMKLPLSDRPEAPERMTQERGAKRATALAAARSARGRRRLHGHASTLRAMAVSRFPQVGAHIAAIAPAAGADEGPSSAPEAVPNGPIR